MASRKEQKDQLRAQRLAAEQQAAAAAARRRRMTMLGGVLALVVVVVVAAIAISSGSSNSDAQSHIVSKNSPAEIAIDKQVSTLLAGIPQSGTVLGNPKAPVTITYYGDLECPICRDFTLGNAGGGFPQLVSNEVKSGKVKVQYRSFCTATCNGPGQSVFNTQQVAAYAAGMQNRFWNFAETFYREQGQEDTGYVNASYLDGIAAQVPGLDISTWQTDRGNPSLLEQVQADGSAGASAGVQGTPALIAQGPKGEEQVPPPNGLPAYSDIEQAIKAVSS